MGPGTRVDEEGRLGSAVRKAVWPSGTSGVGRGAQRTDPCALPGQALLYFNVGGTLCVPVLQVAHGQKVTSLTACLADQSLRLDCRHENTTATPIQYEFSLTRETKKHVLFGTVGVPEHTYRSRTSFTSKYNIKVLYLSSFTTKDEGLYTCELRLSGQPPVVSNKTVSVLRGKASLQQGRVSWERQAGEEGAG